MSELSGQHPSLTSLPEWGAGQTARGRARLPSSRRRERPQLSCNLCRQRKLRCDRQSPCSNCTKRALGMDCTYLPTVDRPSGSGTKEQLPATAQDRIEHLESLLVNLMQAQQGASTQRILGTARAPELTGPDSPAAENPCMLHVPGSGSSPAPPGSSSVYLTKCGATYVTSAHWAAVLNEIAELKGHFEEAEQREIHSHPPFEEPPSPGQAGPQLLYGCSRLLTKEEILASIPARPVVDKLVSCYFNSFEMSPAVLHSAQFLEEYEEFWKNPVDTPVIWLGLLFTLMCLATQFQSYRLKPAVDTPETSSPEKDLQQTAETFRQKIVQCLVLGNYTKGGPYVLQTLMLYVAAELFLSNDAEMGVWILLGTIVQLAMQMGYHRDPKHFKGRSPFASEMHRRVWATIVELDLGISAQMGLPRLIRPWQADTMEPSNLQDHDFDKYTVELPPSRPETDLTPMLFRLVRGRMLTAIGAIWDFATDTRPYTYEAVIEMDARLQDAHACIPNCLKWRSIALCIADTPQTVMQKVSLEIIVHRASIVLHRRYLHCLPTDSKEIHSRQKCLDAALKLLEYQQILQDKTEFLGQLYHERWRVSSLVKHDFLLATSILCSYLQQVKKDIHNGIGNEPVNTIREALRKSHAIWLRSSDSSKEAQKAAEAVSIVLGIEGTSASPSEVNTPCTTTNKTSLFSYPNTDDHFPDNCGVQFPAFHTTAWASWQDQSNFELMVPFSVPVSDAGISPQMMDAMDAMNSLQWPWTN